MRPCPPPSHGYEKKTFLTEKYFLCCCCKRMKSFQKSGHLHPSAWVSVGTGYALLRGREGDATRRGAAQRGGLERGAAGPEALHAPCVTQSC